MKKRYILLVFVVMLLAIFGVKNNSYATDLDRILNYEITVDPRMDDGSLDITYDITWKVLDSDTMGPLTWVKIGTPNSKFDEMNAISDNIKRISSTGSYVRIDFYDAYYAGEQIKFRYSIHQSNICDVSGNKCEYQFTPAWFTDINVDKMLIKWNASNVQSSDNVSKNGNYLVWRKTNLQKGETLTANIKYNKTAFSSNISQKSGFSSSDDYSSTMSKFFIVLIIIYIAIFIISMCSGSSYSRHSGFYHSRPYRSSYYSSCVSSCVRSSCACACARSCACACAGSGRAGCSKKDFYGTNLTSKKIEKAFKKRK